MTAGTAGEETFEVRSSDGQGNGIFTWALLAALKAGQRQDSASAFLTIDQIVADLKITVARFASKYGKSLHPKLWTFDDAKYRGSFVFLNPAVMHSPIRNDHLEKLGAVRTDSKPAERETQVTAAPNLCPGIDIMLRDGSVIKAVELKCGPRDAGFLTTSAPDLRFTANLAEIQEGIFPGRILAFDRLNRIDFDDLDSTEKQAVQAYHAARSDFFNRTWRAARVEFSDGHIWERIYVYDRCSFKSTYEDGVLFDLNLKTVIFKNEECGRKEKESEKGAHVAPVSIVASEGSAPAGRENFPVTVELVTGRKSDYQLLGCRYREGIIGSDYPARDDRPHIAYYSLIEESRKEPCIEGHGTVHLANVRKLIIEDRRHCAGGIVGGTTWYKVAVE